MKLQLVVTCLLVGCLAPSLGLSEWVNFKAQYKKNYATPAEELFRMKMYLRNKMEILAHNLKFALGLVTYQVAVNKFADSLRRESRKLPGDALSANSNGSGFYEHSGEQRPLSVDHRTTNRVTSPQNEGKYKNSWAFSATGALEGQYARKTGVLKRFSPQHLIDCDDQRAGTMNNAFEFVKENGGITTNFLYPYVGQKGSCPAPGTFEQLAQVKSIVNIRPNNEEDLADAVYNVGPISVAIDTSFKMFTFYKSGVFSPGPLARRYVNLNQAALVVGYGMERGMEYWLVKNSWGADWGDKGYVRILKNGNNVCGVASIPSFPILE